jgi:hypothetical protein
MLSLMKNGSLQIITSRSRTAEFFEGVIEYGDVPSEIRVPRYSEPTHSRCEKGGMAGGGVLEALVPGVTATSGHDLPIPRIKRMTAFSPQWRGDAVRGGPRRLACF